MRELEMRQRAGREQQDAPQGEIELNLLIHRLKFLKKTDPPKFEAPNKWWQRWRNPARNH
jgi:hypothetical protein